MCAQIGTSATFDADAYRQSLAANQALHHELQQKKHGSAAIEGESFDAGGLGANGDKESLQLGGADQHAGTNVLSASTTCYRDGQ